MVHTVIYQIAFNMLFSFLSSVTFGIICNVPKRSLLTAGLVGVIGWMGYWSLFSHGSSVFLSSFLCSLLLASAGHIASRLHKMPLTVFYIPGVAPVVPGITTFEAFRDLITHDYNAATTGFLHVGYTAVGLTCGLAVSDMLARVIFGRLNRRAKPVSPSSR